MQAKPLLLADEWKKLSPIDLPKRIHSPSSNAYIMADCMTLCSAVAGQFSSDRQEWRSSFWAKLDI